MHITSCMCVHITTCNFSLSLHLNKRLKILEFKMTLINNLLDVSFNIFHQVFNTLNYLCDFKKNCNTYIKN